jgi:L-alanine-DL-glutamate epimerase-like enolase superfamily enzyme
LQPLEESRGLVSCSRISAAPEGFWKRCGWSKMALDHGKSGVPHCWKTGIGVAATAHVAVVAPNCRSIEFQPSRVAYARLCRELVEEELKVVKGRILLPQRPG